MRWSPTANGPSSRALLEQLPVSHPLTKLPNVILTPHLGWPTDEAYDRFADAAADVLLAYYEGRAVPQFLESHLLH